MTRAAAVSRAASAHRQADSAAFTHDPPDADPETGWQAKVEALGLIWHEGRERPYWDESACYRFTRAQIDSIEAATTELYRCSWRPGRR